MLTRSTLDEEAVGQDEARGHDERNAFPTTHNEDGELVDGAGMRKSKIAAGGLFA
jgi:hypothetical protein